MTTGRKIKRCTGRADPFGLLVLAVLLAVSLTIAVQAQVFQGERSARFEATVAPLAILD